MIYSSFFNFYRQKSKSGSFEKKCDVNYYVIFYEINDVFTVVGLTVVEVIKQPVRCTTAFSCPSSCELGYKCGSDGCPTCQCLIAVPMGMLADLRIKS